MANGWIASASHIFIILNRLLFAITVMVKNSKTDVNICQKNLYNGLQKNSVFYFTEIEFFFYWSRLLIIHYKLLE